MLFVRGAWTTCIVTGADRDELLIFTNLSIIAKLKCPVEIRRLHMIPEQFSLLAWLFDKLTEFVLEIYLTLSTRSLHRYNMYTIALPTRYINFVVVKVS